VFNHSQKLLKNFKQQQYVKRKFSILKEKSRLFISFPPNE